MLQLEFRRPYYLSTCNFREGFRTLYYHQTKNVSREFLAFYGLDGPGELFRGDPPAEIIRLTLCIMQQQYFEADGRIGTV